MKTLTITLFALLLLTAACRTEEDSADAYGTFEAQEVLVSSEVGGQILRLDLEEGQTLEAGQVVGLIDTTALHLQKEQLLASIRAVRQKTQDATPQIEVLKEQRRNLLREKERTEALLAEKAATPQQYDDIVGKMEVIDQQIDQASAQTRIANRGILAEVDPLRARIRQVEEQLRKSYIVNPIDGTVLLKIAEPMEYTAPGKPLYKIAALEEMTLRVYVSGAQLPHLRIGQEATVMIDENREENKAYTGTISWISDEAEFTPKIIQTKEERVNLVYAVKIRVPNDGSLKIGMPGEADFPSSGSENDNQVKTAAQ